MESSIKYTSSMYTYYFEAKNELSMYWQCETNVKNLDSKIHTQYLYPCKKMIHLPFISNLLQLREEFDRGGQITLSMETGVHDVATLLKEFFRDLPEPVLPKEVQSALLATQSMCLSRFGEKMR